MAPRIAWSTALLLLLLPLRASADAVSLDAGTLSLTSVDFSLPATAPQGSSIHVTFQVLDSLNNPLFSPDLKLALLGPAHFTAATWTPASGTFTEGPTEADGTAFADFFLDNYGLVKLCATVDTSVTCQSLAVPSSATPDGVEPHADVTAAALGSPVPLSFQLVDSSGQPVTGAVAITASVSRSDCTVTAQSPTDLTGHSIGHVGCSSAGSVQVCSALQTGGGASRCTDLQFVSSSGAPPTLALSWVEATNETVRPGGLLSLRVDLSGVPLGNRGVVRLNTQLLGVNEVCWEPIIPRPAGQPCGLDRTLVGSGSQYLLPIGAAGHVTLTVTGYAQGTTGDQAVAQALLLVNAAAVSNTDTVKIPIGSLVAYLGCSGTGAVAEPCMAALALVALWWRVRRRRQTSAMLRTPSAPAAAAAPLNAGCSHAGPGRAR